MKRFAVLLLAALLLTGCSAQGPAVPETTAAAPETTAVPTTVPETTAATEPAAITMTFTFAGDCTLGCHTEHSRAGYGFLMTVGEDFDYPFANVKQWFEADDFTMVNLEGVLGDKGSPAGKRYAFRGYGSYTNILTRNSVEAVSLANNHAYDYGQIGYDETKRLLDEAGVPYAEQNAGRLITLENGVTVGIYATVYNSIDEEAMPEGIKALREQGADIVIYAPHWGTEHSFDPTEQQKELGCMAIDAGADIVYGCHPHVLQPIEEYKDGVILYSLGNFAFGGNIYPSDYDTAIIQQEITLEADGTVVLGQRNIIPCSLSSMANRNNYQPTPYEAGSAEYNRVLSKLDGTYDGPNLPVH